MRVRQSVVTTCFDSWHFELKSGGRSPHSKLRADSVDKGLDRRPGAHPGQYENPVFRGRALSARASTTHPEFPCSPPGTFEKPPRAPRHSNYHAGELLPAYGGG